MKRKAILIESSNVQGLKDLPGARVDVQNWKSFLKSDLGGAWEDAEIVMLSKPQSREVDDHLNVAADCYCFVAYSGHGSDGSVVLNDAWIDKGYSTTYLRPKGNKGTLIVDSCRGLKEAVIQSFSGTKMAFANEAGHAVVANARRSRSVVFSTSSELDARLIRKSYGLEIKPRQVWDDSLKRTSSGTVQMLSCSKGQYAGEDPSAGGYYTSLLLQSADLWNQASNFQTVHTTKDAHDYAAGKLPPQQTPEYSPYGLAFPFAVKM